MDSKKSQGEELEERILKQKEISQLKKALKERELELCYVGKELEEKNQELQLVNKEIQLSYEELQVANEELQILNQELYQVNNSYQEKIQELTKANADMDNLLVNAEIGALYIDKERKIRKITPIMVKNTKILLEDVGQPIAKIFFMEEYPNLEQDVQTCCQQECCIEREIVKDGVTWLLRFRPYYTTGNFLDGVLVLLFDITKRLESAKFELQLLTNNIPGGVAKMRYDNGLIIEYANDTLYHMMNLSKEEVFQHYGNHYEKAIYKEDWQKLQQSIEKAIQCGSVIQMEYQAKVFGKTDNWRMMQASILENYGNKPVLQCVITDITYQKEIQFQLDSILDNSLAGIMRFYYSKPYCRLEYVSKQLEVITGYSKEEISAFLQQWEKDSKEESYSKAFDFLLKELDKLLEDGSHLHKEILFQTKTGQKLWLDIRGSVIVSYKKGAVFQIIVNDITQSKQSFLHLEEQRKKLSDVVEMSGEIIYEYDILEDRMKYFMPGEGIIMAEQLTEQYTATVANSNMFEEKKDGILLSNALCSGKENIHMELRRKGSDGTFHWAEIIGKTIYNKQGQPEKVLGKVCNIEEQKRKEEILKSKSQKDSLTGLFNHMTAKQKIRKKLEYWTKGKVGYLVVCDVDNFKKVNDRNGHLFGDAVLCSIADEMVHMFPEAIHGRIGGDEFIFFVENQAKEELEQRLTAFNDAMQERFKDDTMSISCSFGVVTVNEKVCIFDKLFQWADNALYQVKSQGKGAYLILEDFKEEIQPKNQYLVSGQNKDEYIRKEALIQKEEDLVLFSMELLENAADISNALKLIADRTCRFYDFEDMIWIQQEENTQKMVYRWSWKKKKENIEQILQIESEQWENLKKQADKQGTVICRKKTFSAFLLFSKEDIDLFSCFLFINSEREHNWEAERFILIKLASQIFYKMYQVKEKIL